MADEQAPTGLKLKPGPPRFFFTEAETAQT